MSSLSLQLAIYALYAIEDGNIVRSLGLQLVQGDTRSQSIQDGGMVELLCVVVFMTPV